jgi:uncharacterized protein YfiM (DUF2279 family)
LNLLKPGTNISTFLFTILLATLPLLTTATVAPPFFAGDSSAPITETNKRRALIAGSASVIAWTGTFVALNKAWYADYPRRSFHSFNDLPEWNQMDKAGHVWSTYNLSRASAAMWNWATGNRRKAAIIGGLSGIAFESIIEIQDGFSKEWGFSWSDMAANVIGASLFVGQELTWQEQKIMIKMSFNPGNEDGQLKRRKESLFGKSLAEQILKDYNAQTYWLSANIRSLTHIDWVPSWLNLSLGYGSEGLYGGRSNIWSEEGTVIIDRSDIRRTRNWYLSPDIDFTKLRVNSKLLRSVLLVLNTIKIPAPAIGYDGKKITGKWIFF